MQRKYLYLYFLSILFISCNPKMYKNWLPEDIVWKNNLLDYYKIEQVGDDLYQINDTIKLKARINEDKIDTNVNKWSVDTMLSFTNYGDFFQDYYIIGMNDKDSALTFSEEFSHIGHDYGGWYVWPFSNEIHISYTRIIFSCIDCEAEEIKGTDRTQTAQLIKSEGKVKLKYNNRIYVPVDKYTK